MPFPGAEIPDTPHQVRDKRAEEKDLFMSRKKQVAFPHVSLAAGVSSEIHWVTLSAHFFCN